MKKSLILGAALVLTVALAPATAQQQKRVVCYFSSWASYRNGDGKFEAENIDPFLCTHVVYAFVGTNPDGTVRILDSWNDISLNGFKRFNNLRVTNPNLKTMVAIGGWNEGSTGFSNLCRDATLRGRFVTNLYNFVKTHGFSGLELDWEYPAQRGGIAADKANFVSLIRELRTRFNPEGLVLSATVSAGIWTVGASYDIPQLSANLDYINLMTYDYHGSYEGRTGENSPLYAAAIDTDRTLNVNATVSYWVQQGAARSKLNLGVPLYGRTFTLSNPRNTDLGAPASAPGSVGQYSQESGFLMYSEICYLQRTQTGWTTWWNSAQQVPYTYRAYEWIGYENVESVQIKGQYAKANNLGGVMVYALEMDDFRNICAGGRYRLLNSLRSAFLSP
ncbi:acidic mammalian chitinase-like [Neocloeon triangulifer]|uniref:acidic mammalian chitinase-like n=1 Tax=Neocloeon triangulifer TaxID=2078957 RepID=UPI00286F4FAA|nr:acidic mammalian chitinase-like [Neocloeon triangulifer]